MTLVFYDVEEMVHRKSYNRKLSKKQIIKYHKVLCKEYGIRTKLKFDTRTAGYFVPDDNLIVLPPNAVLGVLIHEIAHAYEHKRYGTTFHKDRLFQIINEMNIYAESAI